MKNVKNPKTASVVFDETVGVSKKCSDDWKVSKSILSKRLVKFIDSGLSVKPGHCLAHIKNHPWLSSDGKERNQL